MRDYDGRVRGYGRAVKPFGPSDFWIEVPASPQTARRARQMMTEQLLLADVDLTDPQVEAAMLVFSEMATNAVVHADEPIRIEVELRADGILRMAVCDGVVDLPKPAHPQPGQIGGWGVELVNTLSDSWGAGPRPDGIEGKEVWAQLRL